MSYSSESDYHYALISVSDRYPDAEQISELLLSLLPESFRLTSSEIIKFDPDENDPHFTIEVAGTLDDVLKAYEMLDLYSQHSLSPISDAFNLVDYDSYELQKDYPGKASQERIHNENLHPLTIFDFEQSVGDFVSFN